MLSAVIILSVLMAALIVVFVINGANIKNAIEDIYSQQALLHDKLNKHEDRIFCNYKSLAELNRRQDELQVQHSVDKHDIEEVLKDLQDKSYQNDINDLALEAFGDGGLLDGWNKTSTGDLTKVSHKKQKKTRDGR